MKKPIFPRIISLTALYAGIFILLVIVQFANLRTFTQRVGGFVVSGHYGNQTPNSGAQANGETLDGTVTISFGGMEFFLTGDDGDKGLCVLTSSGVREWTKPLSLSVSGGTARFLLEGGTELSFSTQNSYEAQELRIYAKLPEGYSRLELPYRPLGSSRIRHNNDGESHIIADGKSYRFNNSMVDSSRSMIFLDISEPAISFGQVQGETEIIDPAGFVLSAAEDKRMYDAALIRWRDQSFSRWGQSIGTNGNEETVLAYLSEAVSHGGYRSAVAGIAPDFLTGNQRTFESSAFLGGLDLGLRSNVIFERENLSRLTQLIDSGSTDILKGVHVIEFLAIRGQNNLLDTLSGIIRSLDSASLDPNLLPGILEGYMDWQHFRPNTANPFNALIDQACFAISEGIIMSNQGEQIFYFDQGTADLEFNLRLGAGLAAYGEYAGQEIWGGIGRSLVLSVLSLVDETGTAPLTLTPLALAESGEILPTPAAGTNSLSAARIYRHLGLGDYSARAVGLNTGAGSAMNGIWTWTVAAGVTANFNQENNYLDIAVSFPSGETHYMLIRGIRSFTQIQLYNIPFRTDPQFERYDSSGWAYSPSEQTLMVKMKHRLTTEHILIYY
ncbi:hypothetical protein AGMMS49940_16340 [Spirochaetia bacterium]|nr:hypothetical protein AGMMS49940_16340 [Spirochaetia bacterium]